MRDHLELILPATLDLSHMVRQASKETFKWMGFSQREIQQWELIVDELFMNAVEYGSNPDTATVYLSYQKTQEGAIFQIEDEGSGPQPITAENLKKKIETHKKEATLTDTSGRGLGLIMEKWTDSSSIEQSPKGGILVRVEKNHQEQANIEAQESLLPTAPTQKPSKVIIVNPNVDKPEITPYVISIQKAVDAIESGQSIELNFERVKYINSIFIGHLATWYNQAKGKGAFIVLTHLSDGLKEILTLVGLNKIFNLNA